MIGNDLLRDIQSFENEWVEIAITPPKGWCESSKSIASSSATADNVMNSNAVNDSNVPLFLQPNLSASDQSNKKGKTLFLFESWALYEPAICIMTNF